MLPKSLAMPMGRETHGGCIHHRVVSEEGFKLINEGVGSINCIEPVCYTTEECVWGRWHSSTQRLSTSIYPTKTLTLTLSAEDNYNNLTATNRHAWFGDVALKYKMKWIDWAVQLNNVFNQRTYTRVNYSGLDIYTATSQLRPRNVMVTTRFELL